MKDNQNQSWSSEFNTDQLKNIGNTANPLLAPQGAYLFQAHLRGGGLIEMESLFERGEACLI